MSIGISKSRSIAPADPAPTTGVVSEFGWDNDLDEIPEYSIILNNGISEEQADAAFSISSGKLVFDSDAAVTAGASDDFRLLVSPVRVFQGSILGRVVQLSESGDGAEALDIIANRTAESSNSTLSTDDAQLLSLGLTLEGDGAWFVELWGEQASRQDLQEALGTLDFFMTLPPHTCGGLVFAEEEGWTAYQHYLNSIDDLSTSQDFTGGETMPGHSWQVRWDFNLDSSSSRIHVEIPKFKVFGEQP